MWLLKTEPYDVRLRRPRARRSARRWDGVKNPVALRNLRAMKEGDRVLVYHTGDEKAVVGVAEVTRAAYPDPKAKDPKLVVVDLEAARPAAAAGHAGRDQGACRSSPRARSCARGGCRSCP